MHYPGHLRDAFHDAMDAYLTGAEVDDELFYDPAQQQRWAAMDAGERFRWIAGKLWHCTDIMPGETCAILELEPGSTYARAARRIREGRYAPFELIG
jgi:hypothetical protein